MAKSLQREQHSTKEQHQPHVCLFVVVHGYTVKVKIHVNVWQKSSESWKPQDLLDTFLPVSQAYVQCMSSGSHAYVL